MRSDKNLLLHGDNVKAMRYLLEERRLGGRIDLVYIDPPFATSGGEFVAFIRERVRLLKELLSDRGSIYLHTDYKIGHHLKVMMDDVFGEENFRNDITRVKCNPKNFPRIGYGNIKDMILFYTKSGRPIWNEPRQPYGADDMERLFPKIDKDGRRYTTVPIHAPGETLSQQRFQGMMPPAGRHWRTDVRVLERWNREGLIEWSTKGNPRKIVYADERDGKRVQDVWLDFKDPQYPVYPTEKNAAMLDRIILASSNPSSIVLDCFCGSGTTLAAAARNGRSWIGIDASDAAIRATRKKMRIGTDLAFDAVEEIEV